MFDEEQLRNMSSEDRARLLRTIAEIDATSPAHTSSVHTSTATARPGSRRRRMVVVLVIAICCVLLAAWTGLLAATGACARCGFPVPPDASFCPGCGVLVS